MGGPTRVPRAIEIPRLNDANEFTEQNTFPSIIVGGTGGAGITSADSNGVAIGKLVIATHIVVSGGTISAAELAKLDNVTGTILQGTTGAKVRIATVGTNGSAALVALTDGKPIISTSGGTPTEASNLADEAYLPLTGGNVATLTVGGTGGAGVTAADSTGATVGKLTVTTHIVASGATVSAAELAKLDDVTGTILQGTTSAKVRIACVDTDGTATLVALTDGKPIISTSGGTPTEASNLADEAYLPLTGGNVSTLTVGGTDGAGVTAADSTGATVGKLTVTTHIVASGATVSAAELAKLDGVTGTILQGNTAAIPKLAVVAADGTMTVLEDGTSGQHLVTDGTGGYSWATP